MMFVKICGLRTAEHALVAAEAGADLLGFIFAPARRQIDPSEATRIGAAVRAIIPPSHMPTLVGVFVDEAPERMRAVAEECGLGAIQLSGDEAPAIASQLAGIAIVKTIRFQDTVNERAWLQNTPPNVRLHVDAHVPGAYGGAGVRADWEQSQRLARQHPILLAGGLTPANVGAAIGQVRPWGVDVSSGVETDGVKDSAKIRAFVAAARRRSAGVA
jgi:phosphoribosylanthranilate isomerase